MTIVQKRLVRIFSFLSLFVLALDHIFPGLYLVRYCKLAVLATLFLSSLTFRTGSLPQKMIQAGLFFVVVGDALFVFNNDIRIRDIQNYFPVLGAAGFAAAYLLLGLIFSKSFRPGRHEFLALAPILAVLIFLYIQYGAGIPLPTLAWLLLFSVVLGSMTWLSFCTVFSGYYSLRVAYLMAVSGYLIFISDIGVGLAVFNPDFVGRFVIWLENIIWVTFIAAWTTLVILAAEERLTADSHTVFSRFRSPAPIEKNSSNLHK